MWQQINEIHYYNNNTENYKIYDTKGITRFDRLSSPTQESKRKLRKEERKCEKSNDCIFLINIRIPFFKNFTHVNYEIQFRFENYLKVIHESLEEF